MLQTIREHTQGWIAGIIISLIILSFALWGIHSYFEGGSTNPAMAIVNGIEISKNQVSLAYDRLRRQIQYTSSTPLSTKDEVALKTTALHALVEIEVLKQVSLKEGFVISDHQVDGYLQNMPEFQKNGQFSVDRFNQILMASHLSARDFLNLIQTSLLIDQPKLGIVFSSFAFPEEAQSAIEVVNQEREIAYLLVKTEPYLKDKILIYPEQIESYYKAHLSEFKTPEQVKVDYLQVGLKDLIDAIKPTEDQLKAYYKENIKSYVSQPQWQVSSLVISPKANQKSEETEKTAELVYKSILNGNDFASFRKQYPDMFTHKNFLLLNQFPSEMQSEVLKLDDANTVSHPIKTKDGYVILKLIEKKNSSPESYETVKDQVKIAYTRQSAEEKFAEIKEKLADLTYEHPDTLSNAAKALNLPIKSSEFFSKERPGKDISQFVKVRNAAFNNDVVNLRNNSDVLQIDPETLIVLRVNTYSPSSLLPLSSMSHQIEDKLKREEAEKLAAKHANQIKELLSTGVDPKNVAAQYRRNWHPVGYVGHYSTKVDSAILETAFHMSHPTNKNKQVYEVTKLSDGYAVVALKSIKKGEITDKKQNSVFSEQLQSSSGLYEYELYKQSKVKNAKVKFEMS